MTGRSFVKSQRRNSNGDFIFAAAVDTRFSIQDSFYLDKKLYDEYAPYINRCGDPARCGSITDNREFDMADSDRRKKQPK